MVRSCGDDGSGFFRYCTITAGVVCVIDPDEDHLHRTLEWRALSPVLEADDSVRIFRVEADHGFARQSNMVLHR